MKGLPLSYNRDMQEDKESLFDAYDTVYSCLGIFTKMIGTASWNTEKMHSSCVGGHANATDVADYLVRKGMPFRTAHGVAAKAVRMGIDANCNIEDLSIEQLKECSELIEDDIFALITPEACVNARTVTGGPSEKSVEVQLQSLKEYCAKFN
jgi:argininosuccinate lyase